MLMHRAIARCLLHSQAQRHTLTHVSSLAVLSHSMSNCHRSRTSLLSMLEMTTTRRCTRHLQSHSERSSPGTVSGGAEPRQRPCASIPPPGTFHLLHHVVEVVLQLGVGGDQQGEPVLLDAGEGLGGVDAPLVQDAVDPIGWGAT